MNAEILLPLASTLPAAGDASPPIAKLIALLVFGIALLLVLILRIKLQAFLSLIVVSVVVAAASRLVNPDAVPLTQVAGTIVDSMGGALGFIATIIGIAQSLAQFWNTPGGHSRWPIRWCEFSVSTRPHGRC